jgi:MFS family permease
MSMGAVNFGLFIGPMSTDLGINRTMFGLATTVRTIGSGISAPFIGRLLDRRGARLALALAGLFLGLALIGLSRVSATWQMVALMGLIGLIGMQGGLSLYSQVPISHWFVRKRGKALSLTFVGGPLALLATLPLTAVMIEQLGWRTTWLVLGVVGGTIVSTIGVGLIRRRPEDMGLHPDGDVPEDGPPDLKLEPTPKERRPQPEEYPWTRHQAMRTRAFWLMSIGYGMGMFGAISFVFFRIDYFIEQGIAPTVASLGAATDALLVVIVTLALTPFIDRITLRYLGALGITVLVASLGIAAAFPTVPGMFLANFVFGLGMGMNIGSQNAVWPSYFGRANIGSIRGAAFPITLLFSALGTPIAGIMRDLTGSYPSAWLVGMGPMAIGAVLVFLNRRPASPALVPHPQRRNS